MAIKRCIVPAGVPAGTVSVGKDDAGQICLLIADDTGGALEAALSLKQAAALGWNLIWLAEPRSATALSAPRSDA